MASPNTKSDSYSSSSSPSPSKIARIPLNLRAHKGIIAFHVSLIFLTSCLIPLAVYYPLFYKTSVKPQIIFAIVTPIFGVVSLYSLIMRTIRLLSPTSRYLPLGQKSKWGLDYFDWNFIGGFIAVSVIISIGISRKPSNIRIVSLPLPILLLQVCLQMVALIPLRAMNVRAPFRFSSIGKGEPLKPASYVIAEDIVAVDAKQGDVFRAQFKARYESSPPIRTLLARLDLLWGVTGTLVAGGIIAVIFAVEQTDVGWAVGMRFPKSTL